MAKGWKRRDDGTPYKANHSDMQKATRLITQARHGFYGCYVGTQDNGKWRSKLVGMVLDQQTAEAWLRGEEVELKQPLRRRPERTGLMARLFGR